MSQIQFTHLHTHSPEGSLLDGFMRIEKAVKKVKENGMDALGISDHGTMAAHYKFNEVCKKEGIHPIFGTEAYITYDKKYTQEDFQKVEIEKDKEGNYIFSFMKPEDISGDWMSIEWFPTKKKQTEVERLAKQEYYPDLYRKSFKDEALIPEKKNAFTKGMNALVKAYKEEGYQLCIKADTTQRDFFEWFPWSGHLLLIAKDNEGYQNLLRLNNIANLEGFYRKPRIDYEDIKKYGKGIIATTACRGSVVNQLLLRGRRKEAIEEIERYVEAFDEVYLEMQPSRSPEQLFVNETMLELSKELNLPIIATTDAHMVDKDEEELHATMTNIGQGSTNYEADESDISAYDTAYLMTQEEILSYGIPRLALQNAYDLSHKCHVTFLDDITVKYPEYEVPAGYTFDSYLEELSWQGLFDLFLKKDYITNYKEYEDRLTYELQVIKDKGLSAYFLIVADYMRWAKNQGIYTGPARGSAGGCLVAMVIGITNLDPIRYGLLFSRFLNPTRKGLPDIDSDLSSHRREDVIEYLQEKYGYNHVANIGTYQTMTSKAILKNVGKVMGIDHNIINDWNKKIPAPNGKVMPIQEAIEEITEIYEAAKEFPEVFELAEELQAMPKSKGIHASGFEIAPVNLMDNIPLMAGKNGEIVTQYDGGTLESLGLIKFDILAVKVLSIIEIAINLIKERTSKEIDINELEPNDKEVFKNIQSGNTFAIFQLSSQGMTDIFTRLTEVTFDSLIAGIALYRPGPMQFIDDYIERANGLKEVEYLVPALENVLKETFGLPIYQESIMQMTQVLGNYSDGQADNFRKAISKKKKEILDIELPALKKAIITNGYNEEIANETIKIIEPYAAYSFNKSHSAGYAFLAYQTAYLKTYYPLEFFIANLTIEKDKDEVAQLILDARKNKLEVLPPDVNFSQREYSYLDDNTIIYGLDGIKLLREKSIEVIMNCRPFDSFEEMVIKTSGQTIDKGSWLALVYSGALDNLKEFKEMTRGEILQYVLLAKGYEIAEELIPLIDDFTNINKLELEKEYLGTYITGHPLEGLAPPVDWNMAIKEESNVTSLATITRIKTITTKKGDAMAFVELSFIDNTIDGVMFPNVWNEGTVKYNSNTLLVPYKHLLEEGMIVKVQGFFENKRQLSFIIQKINIPLKYNYKFREAIEKSKSKYGILIEKEKPIEMPSFNVDEI